MKADNANLTVYAQWGRGDFSRPIREAKASPTHHLCDPNMI